MRTRLFQGEDGARVVLLVRMSVRYVWRSSLRIALVELVCSLSGTLSQSYGGAEQLLPPFLPSVLLLLHRFLLLLRIRLSNRVNSNKPTLIGSVGRPSVLPSSSASSCQSGEREREREREGERERDRRKKIDLVECPDRHRIIDSHSLSWGPTNQLRLQPAVPR